VPIGRRPQSFQPEIRPIGPRSPLIWLVNRPLWWRPRHLIPAALLLPGGSMLLYARFVEPALFRVRRPQLELPGASPAFHSSLVHLSDLHLRRDDWWARRLLRTLDRARVQDHPVGVITGDFAKHPYRIDEVLDLLRRMPRPRSGWFAVPGGWEYTCGLSGDDFEPFCRDAGLIPLVNRSVRVDFDGQPVNLVGIDDPERGDPDLPAALADADPTLPTIALCHHPDMLDEVAQHPVDLFLTGHSHGGQVRLPGIGPLWLARGCRKYHDGVHAQGTTTMAISRGIGTTVAPVRLFTPPEFSLIRLRGPSVPNS
jgi:hypothetical protein